VTSTARSPREPRIRDLVEVAGVDTVVRLDGRPGRLEELVLTGDVRQSLAAVLEHAGGEAGAGFLLVGHFGSGKSHFLAAVGELLTEPRRVLALPAWDASLRAAALAARTSHAVMVSLVEYRAEANLEELAWRRCWEALDRQPPPLSTDRKAAWGALLQAVRAGGRQGLVLGLDELSEFLRAKRGPGLTEDLRFLQFLGEWARQQPVLVLGALQESLDEVANVSERELARVRDRYPVRLGLSMRHVEDLVRGRLVLLREGAEAEVERIYRALRAAFPGWQVSSERFRACYPVHPETLTLLDGLRFVLSQQRGVVDFICRQLRGDEAAGIEPWLDQPADRLLGPDRVYDHFQARLRERVETSRLAETVVPYYERTVPTLLEAEPDRELALRAVKLLTLLAASPLERRRSAEEVAELLLCRVSALDPKANAGYLAQAVLKPLAAHGAYVVELASPGGADTYEVALEADAALTAARLLEQARAQLQPEARRVIDSLMELGASTSVPLGLLREGGRSRRQVIWEHTLRQVLVTSARLPELGQRDLRELEGALGRTRAEVALVVCEVEPPGARLAARAHELALAAQRVAFWVPDPLTPQEREFAVELLSRQLLVRQVAAEGSPATAGLLQFLQRSAESDVARAREVVRRCYFQGQLVAAGLGQPPDLPALGGQPFDTILRELVAAVLRALHPRHHEVQPHAELVSDRHLRRLVSVALAGPRLTVGAAAREGVRGQVDGYLVPLGLVRRRGEAYHVAPDPARSLAVAELLRLVGSGPLPAPEVTRALGQGAVGLTEPECLLLLNAAVASGIVEATRGRRPVAAPFLTLDEVDRVGPGELLAPELRGLVLELGGVFGPGPHEPWDARVQQASWEYARAWLEARREETAQARDGIRLLAESPLHAGLELDALPEELDRLDALLAGVDLQAGPREGLEQLLQHVGVPDDLLAAARRVASAARFCRADLGAYAAAVGYLLDPALSIPETPAYEGLRADREEALARAGEVLALAAEDDARRALESCDHFRRAYAAAYTAEHARYQAAAGPEAIRAMTASPSYRALALLSEVAPSAVADDRARVDRSLASSAPVPCSRQVETELALRPVCGCGFALGTEPRRVDVEGLLAIANRGVAQHLAQLGQTEPRRRLEQAAQDLASLGQAEVAGDLTRLLELAARPDQAEAAAVAHLLHGPVRGVLRQVLLGGQVVVRRDLAGLRESLAGRRYPKRRLLELLREWVDGAEGLAEQAVVEVEDTAEGSGASPPAAGATVQALEARYPALAACLPSDRPAEAFWLAAWWAGRPRPPAWLPPRLLEDPAALRAAAAALAAAPGPVAELAELDRRVQKRTLLADQVETALDPGGRGAADLVGVLLDERLLRYPVRAAAGELVRRLAAEPGLAARVPPGSLAHLAAEHPLLAEGDLACLEAAVGAAGALASLERRLPTAAPAGLVGDLYPSCAASVPGLLSEAAAGWPVFGAPADALRRLEAAAHRLLVEADRALETAAAAGFPGCLPLWEVGRVVVEPLLREHGRVVVLLVDAMRADLWLRLRGPIQQALPTRAMAERWAVVPAPTRTAEAVASLALGRQVGAGEAPDDGAAPPFAHLGYETRLLVGADRDGQAEDLLELWRTGPPLSVAVATGVDERLHRSPIDLAALLSESATALERRVLATLRVVPDAVPLVVLADHGFRENRSWGRGAMDRYAHGGLSLAESVVPVAVLAPGGGSPQDQRAKAMPQPVPAGLR
jgi:Family of unknown function (DUF6079)